MNLAEKKDNNHAKIGVAGNVNWDVRGMSIDKMYEVGIRYLINGSEGVVML
jgi:hypothetical protein